MWRRRQRVDGGGVPHGGERDLCGGTSSSSRVEATPATRERRNGARGYLLKGASQSDVIDAIRAAARGHVILGPGAAERLLERLNTPTSRPVFPELTERERQVLALVADGHDNATIGRHLDVSPKTVANNISNILTKLQITTRAQAIVTARRAGLGHDPPG